MRATTRQLLKIFFQRQFRWTRLGNGWVVLRPWLRIAPFFLFGLTHVDANSSVSVLLLNLAVWSMLDATYRAGVLSWRYFEKEELSIPQHSMWGFYLTVGVIEAVTTIPLIVLSLLVDGSTTQLMRSLTALPLLLLLFSPFVIALGEISFRVSTRFWDLKFIGGALISSLIFVTPVLRPFQSTFGVEVLSWNPLGFPFWLGRSFVLTGSFSMPQQALISYLVGVGAILLFALLRAANRKRRQVTLRTVADQGQLTEQYQEDDLLDEELGNPMLDLPIRHDVRFQVSASVSGIDLVRLAINIGDQAVVLRSSEIRIEAYLVNHSVAHRVYPRFHIHKHDGKHIFSLTWPDGLGLELPIGQVTQISTKIPKLTLGIGEYFVSMDVCTYEPFSRYISSRPLVRFEIQHSERDIPQSQRSPHDRKGYFQPQFGWQTRSLATQEYAKLMSESEANAAAFQYDS
jgi:ABC-type polysaccharide/polyol phosphate export permease